VASHADSWGDAAGSGGGCGWKLLLRQLEGGWLGFGRWLSLDCWFLIEDCLLLEDCLWFDDDLLLDYDYWLLRETLLGWPADEFADVGR